MTGDTGMRKPLDRLAMDIVLAVAKLRDEVRALIKEVAHGRSDA